MIACIRTNSLSAERAQDYKQQIELNRKYLRKSVFVIPYRYFQDWLSSDGFLRVLSMRAPG